MKLILLSGLMAAVQFSNFAQGTIVFANRNIPILSGGTTGGGNGNGTYNVPIWRYDNPFPPQQGAGSLPGGVTVGLFTAGAIDSAIPLATTILRTDANSQFFAISSQTVAIPGSDAGTTANLLVRAWQGGGSFAAAKSSGTMAWSEWSFTTRPLGGTPASGGLPITPPSMTGWGPEDGSGFIIFLPEPTTISLIGLSLGAIFLRRKNK